MNKLEQINNLEAGRGIQCLLDAAYKVFFNPIVMFDTNYILIAYTDTVTDDPLWNELISTGTFSMVEQEFFRSECITEDVANADKLVLIKSGKLKYDRLLANIFNRENIKVANIVMVESSSQFDGFTQAAFEAFSDKISHEIQNDDYFTEFGRTYHETLINKILDCQIKDTGIYTSHIQILYDGFDDYLYLAVVDVMNLDRLVFFRNLLEKRYPSFKFAIYSDYVLMVISSNYDIFSTQGILGGHDNPFEQNGIFVGISSSFECIYELTRYYNEAITALKNGIVGKSGHYIFPYDSV